MLCDMNTSQQDRARCKLDQSALAKRREPTCLPAKEVEGSEPTGAEAPSQGENILL